MKLFNNKKAFLHGVGVIVLIGIVAVIFFYYSDNLSLPSPGNLLGDVKDKVSGLGKNNKNWGDNYYTSSNERSGNSNSVTGASVFRKEYVASYVIFYGESSIENRDQLRQFGIAILKPENWEKIPSNAICRVNSDYAKWRIAGCQGFYVDNVDSELEDLKSVDSKTVIVQKYKTISRINEYSDFVLFEGLTTSAMDEMKDSEEIQKNRETIKEINKLKKRILTLDYATSELVESRIFANSRSVDAIPFISKTLNFTELE